MSNIASVIAWKFNDQPGMTCREIDGVMTIVEFPGGIPSQAQQTQWTAEYEAAGGDAEREREQAADLTRVDPYLKALVKALNKGTFTPGQNYTGQQLKAIIKAEL